MRKNKFLIYGLFVALLLCSLTGCAEVPPQPSDPITETTTVPTVENKDYAGSLELDMDSATLKQEVTVKLFIDGDTTHFHVPASVNKTGVLKARYLSINTPESTGKIEEYGKKASAFTKEKLSSAASIVLESESDRWNYDGNGRYLVWVWYKPTADAEYRNLNIELLQNGLAPAPAHPKAAMARLQLVPSHRQPEKSCICSPAKRIPSILMVRLPASPCGS